jgi:hypothetical protein
VALPALGIPTIACTWQHRPIDIVIGMLYAVLGIVAARALTRWLDRRRTMPPTE